MEQEYKIVEAESSLRLTVLVNKHLTAPLEAGKTSWCLVGGAFFVPEHGALTHIKHCWAQTLVRETCLGF